MDKYKIGLKPSLVNKTPIDCSDTLLIINMQSFFKQISHRTSHFHTLNKCDLRVKIL